MTSLTGPSDAPVQTFTYDAMGRLSSGGATYGPAGELLTFNGQTRTYNALGQLTRMTKAGVMDMEYRYTAGQNNGRVWQSKDYVTGEEVTYQYDALNRLARAETTDSLWGNAYTYDGWGNLTGKSVTKGTAPTLSVAYDPALNMTVGSQPPSYVPVGYAEQWDVEDRPLNGQSAIWTGWSGQPVAGHGSYDPSGKKVFWTGTVIVNGDEEVRGCEVYFYGITGQKLARYKCEYGPGTDHEPDRIFYISPQDRTQHIGGQLTVWNDGASAKDRLGSLRARGTERYTYYPYGEPRTATVPGGGVYAGLESPVRNYLPTTGRFDRPDPLGLGAVKLGDPGSWNRFAYVQGDPVNYVDPLGLLAQAPIPGYCPPEYTYAQCWCLGIITGPHLGDPQSGTISLLRQVAISVDAWENSGLIDLVQPLPSGGYGVTTSSLLPAAGAPIAAVCIANPRLCTVIAVGSAVTVQMTARGLADLFIRFMKEFDAESPSQRLARCLQEFTTNLKNCADAYPPGPERAHCFEMAAEAFRRCKGEGVQ